MGRFETEVLTQPGNLAALTKLSGKRRDSAAAVARAGARLTPARAEIAGKRRAGGGALSAFGREPVLNAIEVRNHLPKSQKARKCAAANVLDSTGRMDRMPPWD